MTTIMHSGGSLVPTAVERFSASRTVNTIVHDLLNREDPDVTFRPAGLRTGRFRLVFENEDAALSAYDTLASAQPFTILNPAVTPLNMTFIVAGGDLTIEQDSDVATLWRIDVPFQEVTP